MEKVKLKSLKTLVEISEDLLTCSICFHGFSLSVIPLVLKCGHNLCQNCLISNSKQCETGNDEEDNKSEEDDSDSKKDSSSEER